MWGNGPVTAGGDSVHQDDLSWYSQVKIAQTKISPCSSTLIDKAPSETSSPELIPSLEGRPVVFQLKERSATSRTRGTHGSKCSPPSHVERYEEDGSEDAGFWDGS